MVSVHAEVFSMRVFKNYAFARFARQQKINDQILCDVVAQAEAGLIDADLGGGVIKQRIARPNEGKSGGFRTILVFRAEDRAVFVYGFPKNERGNIGRDELKAFKLLAAQILSYDAAQLQKAVEADVLTEICGERNDEQNEQNL